MKNGAHQTVLRAERVDRPPCFGIIWFRKVAGRKTSSYHDFIENLTSIFGDEYSSFLSEYGPSPSF
jgi:hypothetical protein